MREKRLHVKSKKNYKASKGEKRLRRSQRRGKRQDAQDDDDGNGNGNDDEVHHYCFSKLLVVCLF